MTDECEASAGGSERRDNSSLSYMLLTRIRVYRIYRKLDNHAKSSQTQTQTQTLQHKHSNTNTNTNTPTQTHIYTQTH